MIKCWCGKVHPATMDHEAAIHIEKSYPTQRGLQKYTEAYAAMIRSWGNEDFKQDQFEIFEAGFNAAKKLYDRSLV